MSFSTASWDVVRAPGDRRLYVYRHAQLTVRSLLSRQKRWHDALASADALIQLATDAGDQLLRQMALLTKAELLQDVGNTREAMETLDIVVDTLAQQPPQLYAQYERILACALAGEGDRRYRHPALRACPPRLRGDPQHPGPRRALPPLERDDDAPGREWDEPRAPVCVPLRSNGTAVARNVVQTVAALLRHHSRPELVARELVHLLSDTDCVVAARASSTGSDGLPQRPRRCGNRLSPTRTGSSADLSVGVARDRAVDVDLKVRPDIESQATVNGVTAAADDDCRTWSGRAPSAKSASASGPSTTIPPTPSHAVVGGHMRELMADAKRIGRHQRQRPHHRRKRHRQGDPRPRHPRLLRPRRTSRSSPSTAPPSRATCSRASCSATAAAPSPAPTATTPA